ncbi:MAG: hypothetical protein ABWZ40_03645 [Caulobacterales bacterium]
MSTNLQRLCVWSGPIFIILFFAALLCAGFIPPSAPQSTPAEIAAMYREHTLPIRLGMALQIVAAGFQFPFVAVISNQLSRIGPHARTMSYMQLGAGSAGVLLFIVPPLFWSVAAFRPEARSEELIYLLHDLGWMFFIVPFVVAFFQLLAMAAAMLMDQAPQPIFPRWLGYANAWIATLLAPGLAAIFFKTGPFAWNGIFVFWLPATVFGAWFVAMTMALLSAIKREARQKG